LDKRLQERLVCPGCRSGLVFLGEDDETRLLSGELVCAGCGIRYEVVDEIPNIVLPGTRMDGAAWEGGDTPWGRARTRLVEFFLRAWAVLRLWVWSSNPRLMTGPVEDPAFRRFVETVQRIEGVVLDLASGPGGSFCIPVMMDGRRNRLLVMSDLGAPVMSGWRKALRRKGWGDRCSNMVFDARKIPFSDGSVDAVSSLLGFSSIDHNDAAYREARRVLVLGGLLIDVVRFHHDRQRRPPRLGQVASDRGEYENYLEGLGLPVESSEALMTKPASKRDTPQKREDRVYYARRTQAIPNSD
jgi:uncharacterized protein YbaR (Trm112 family)